MSRSCGFTLFLTLFTFALWSPDAAHAQRRSYRTSRPTISPYLDLLRVQTGALPNYYELVRPKLEIQESFRQQQARIVGLQQRLRRVQGTVDEITGIGGQFRTNAPYFRNSAAFFGTRGAAR